MLNQNEKKTEIMLELEIMFGAMDHWARVLKL